MLGKVNNFIRGIKYGIRSLYLWFPVIWSDRNWDYHYIFKILRHKFYITEQCILKYGYHADCEKVAKQLRLCVLLLDRLMADNYDLKLLESHYKKWGSPKLNTVPSENRPDTKILKITQSKVKTEEDRRQEREEFRSLLEKASRQKLQDLDYLCKMINKYIWNWWD